MAGGDGRCLVEEEDPLGDVAAAGDRPQRRRAVETPIDTADPMPTEDTGAAAGERSAVGAEESPPPRRRLGYQAALGAAASNASNTRLAPGPPR